MFVLVEEAAEAVTPMDSEFGDPSGSVTGTGSGAISNSRNACRGPTCSTRSTFSLTSMRRQEIQRGRQPLVRSNVARRVAGRQLPVGVDAEQGARNSLRTRWLRRLGDARGEADNLGTPIRRVSTAERALRPPACNGYARSFGRSSKGRDVIRPPR